MGDQRRCLCMPIGGVGTGTVSICGDGSLRQWQLSNRVQHNGFVPNSFFALRIDAKNSFVLQTEEFWDEADFVPAAGVSDHVIPLQMKSTLSGLPKINGTQVNARYPIFELEYLLPNQPVTCKLTAWNPIGLNRLDISSIPCAIFEFEIRNTSDSVQSPSIAFALQNFLGWDGVNRIVGNGFPGFGGNENRCDLQRVDLLNKRFPEESISIRSSGKSVTFRNAWTEIEDIWTDFSQDGALKEIDFVEPSHVGQTWNCAICNQHFLNPGESEKSHFVLTWRFPNRTVDFGQFGNKPNGEFLGNDYCGRFLTSAEANQFVTSKFEELRMEAFRFRDQMFDSTLPEYLIDRVTANIVPLRSSITFQDSNGDFFGFEGGCGAFSGGEDAAGGCCPMNCTHVWNYDQTLVNLWPDLFENMRQTDWIKNQNIEGFLPHRSHLPITLNSPKNEFIGGPENPALDGLFGSILKSIQLWQRTGDRKFDLHIERALEYVFSKHDIESNGVIVNEQPCTYDISLFSANPFIGFLYLAVLKASKSYFATTHPKLSNECERRFLLSKVGYESECWNGEQFVQRIETNQYPYQFVSGCMSDQLLGQWWANQLGIGDLVDREKIKKSLKTIFTRNFYYEIGNTPQSPRQFASSSDRGLINVTYLDGDRPQVPLLYSDEFWTGVEYTVAALMIRFGMISEGLQIVRAVADRYNGEFRNPFNEIECGDHYVRAMSAMSLYQAFSGITYLPNVICFEPILIENRLKVPFFTNSGIGNLDVKSVGGINCEISGFPQDWQCRLNIGSEIKLVKQLDGAESMHINKNSIVIIPNSETINVSIDT